MPTPPEATVDPKSHWERVYRAKRPEEVSWFQPHARLSLQLIEQVAPDRRSAIIDVGGGASTLVDDLVRATYSHITVLDLARTSLDQAQNRLQLNAQLVTWREADVLTSEFAAAEFDVWHDRAVFHFLTDPASRARYVAQVMRALRPDGYAIVATFAEDGPTRCSGLAVARYSAEALHDEFGAAFRLINSYREAHVTPNGVTQAFTYCVCRYEPHASTQHAA
jgi:2-polyprenyl-3-methyl-5-hydroxy-6-metoxy-1,4-benzoquinol methylase